MCVATQQPPQLSGDFHGRDMEPSASAIGTYPLVGRSGHWRICWRRKNGTAASVWLLPHLLLLLEDATMRLVHLNQDHCGGGAVVCITTKQCIVVVWQQ